MGRLEVCEHIKDCADGKGMMGASIVMTTCAGVEGMFKVDDGIVWVAGTVWMSRVH